MLPVLSAIGAGLSALSALKNLTSSASTSSKATPVAGNSTTAGAAAPAGASGATTGTASAGATNGSEMQDRFLKLLVTQMKNQDPLNPMDNAQVTSQLAQISTVGGIDKLNNTLAGLSSSMLSSQQLQSSSIIGRNVLAAGSSIALAGGKAAGGLNLGQDADRVFVSITDGNGALVRTLQLGAARAGMSTFEWDGKTDAGGTAPNGLYNFQITAARGTATIPAESLVSGKVGGLSLGNGATRLNLESGGDIGIAEVKRIL